MKSTTILVAAFVFFLGGCTATDGTPPGVAWTSDAPYDPASIASLVLIPDRDFRILILADIQLGLDPFRNSRSLKTVRGLAKAVSPDLILTVGDNTSGPFAPWLTRRLVGTMESIGIPWGVTLGNHDTESLANREWHGRRYAEADLSLFRSGPGEIHGVGNYGINLVDGSGNPVFALILMDSNVQRRYEEGMDYDYVHADQIQWYEWMARGAREAGAEVSLAFFHIPIPEHADAVNAWNAGTIDRVLGFGETREGVFAPPENSGLFETIKRVGSTTHVFVGHDHLNNLSVEYQGIRLTYVLKTGPSSYHDADLQGGTLVTLDPVSRQIGVEHVYRGE